MTVLGVGFHPVSGYACVWGSVISNRSAVHGAGGNISVDVLALGCFAKAIARHKAAGTAPKMFLSHDETTGCVGRWTSFEEDERGLRMIGFLDLRAEAGNAALGMIRAGMIVGLSVGRGVGKAHISGAGVAVITEAELPEVSLALDPHDPLALLDGLPRMLSPLEQRLAEQMQEARAVKAVGCDIRVTDFVNGAG